ncbi:RdgB/HAM1 family non-canonical purine NTP pyrophosphatase [Candidatus Latescibacterota bacterium]
MKLVIATANRGKFSEFTAFLNNTGIDLYSLADFASMPEIIEDGSSFLENSLIKACAVSSFTGLPALADDSGLEVDALDGRPGVMSARFAPTSEERNRKLLNLLKDVDDEFRTARFVCALALVRPDDFEWTTIGICEGSITRKPVGQAGFGYDPVFYYKPLGATFAEIPKETKNRISHRGIALAAFKEAIIKNGILHK